MSDELDAEISATPGYEPTLTFNEHAGAGYIWQAKPVDNVNISSKILDTDENAIGGDVKRQFTISSEIQGTYDLQFVHKREFEDTPIETVNIRFTVKNKLEF